MKVLHSAVVLSNQFAGSKIVTFTRHGFMARGWPRCVRCTRRSSPSRPIAQLFRQLRMLRSVEPFLMPFAAEPDLTIENRPCGSCGIRARTVGDKLIIATDILAQDRRVDSVQLRTVQS